MERKEIIEKLKELSQNFNNELDTSYEIKSGVKNHYETNKLRQIQNEIAILLNML